MSWAPPALLQNKELGPALQQAGYGQQGKQDPYWYNKPASLQPDQGAWNNTPGLLQKGFPDSWFTKESLGQSTQQNQPTGWDAQATSNAMGPRYGPIGGTLDDYMAAARREEQARQAAYGGGSPGPAGLDKATTGPAAPYVPGGGGIGLQSNAFTTQMANQNNGAGWDYNAYMANLNDISNAQDRAYNLSGAYNIPAGAAKGAPASGYQHDVANRYLYNLNSQANTGSAPSIPDALVGAGKYYGLDFQPLGNSGRGWVADLPANTPWW